MVCEQFHNHPLQSIVVFDPGILAVRILHGILVGLIRGHFSRDFLCNDLANLVRVFPINVPKLLVERLDDVAQPIQFRLNLVPTSPPASPVARTFTLTATRQDDDSIGGISNFLSFPIDGFTS